MQLAQGGKVTSSVKSRIIFDLVSHTEFYIFTFSSQFRMMALLKYHTRFHKLTVIFFMCSQTRFYLSLFSVYDFFSGFICIT